MTIKKTITLKSDLIKKLEKIALTENRSFSNLMETISIWYLKRKSQ
jgi:predicted CopG family antitoxin